MMSFMEESYSLDLVDDKECGRSIRFICSLGQCFGGGILILFALSALSVLIFITLNHGLLGEFNL